MSENVTRKAAQTSTAAAKKRPALANITNLKNGIRNFVNSSRPSTLVPSSRKISKKKESSTSKLPADLPLPTDVLVPYIDPPPQGNHQPEEKIAISPALAPDPSHDDTNSIISEYGKADASSSKSDRSSDSLAETMSICDSLLSPEDRLLDNSSLNVSDSADGVRDLPIEVEGVVDEGFDGENEDRQFCSDFKFEIYKNLRKSEAHKRPAFDYMENVQTDINAGMRAILIDWLVEVAEDYKLVPETLFLTVNYIDRYLSLNFIDRKRLQLLGIACMMIAAKFEEIKAPEVHEFCYITDYTYTREEAVQMESSVLNHLKFEMSAPTTQCFLRHFIHAAQQNQQIQSLKFECLANYLTELSLLDYKMLRYAPSIIAASVIFLAKFILSPRNKPWDFTLKNYSLYQPSKLTECVKALHSLHCSSNNSHLLAIREKYSQHKYKFVAKQYCPTSIPQDYFQDLCS